jgi:two-component system chemotaxis response regulator CheY
MKKTILVVDDSDSIRSLVSFTLETAGYTVLTGIDGQDALQYLEDNEISMIITDLHMPNLDGIGFIRQVRTRTNYQFTPILLLTTESQAEKKEEAKQAGATGWIVKPFQQDKLLATVQKLIR